MRIGKLKDYFKLISQLELVLRLKFFYHFWSLMFWSSIFWSSEVHKFQLTEIMRNENFIENGDCIN